jgi:hypothetical protein
MRTSFMKWSSEACVGAKDTFQYGATVWSGYCRPSSFGDGRIPKLDRCKACFAQRQWRNWHSGGQLNQAAKFAKAAECDNSESNLVLLEEQLTLFVI